MRNSNPNLKNSSVAKQWGLTLVELLVAISVLGLVAVLGWRGLDSIVRSRIALTDELEQTRGMQISIAQLQSDCAQLADSATLPDRPTLAIIEERLMLVRTVFADNQPTRLQVVTYQLKDGQLTRRESASTRDLRELDALWQATAKDIDTAQEVKLQSEVNAMTMKLWIGNGWRDGLNTVTPSATNPIAPTGLEITMRLRGSDTGIKKVFLLGAA